MTKVTLQTLKDMEPATIFAKGDKLNYDGGFMKWIAIRGGIWDWAIYYTKNHYENDERIHNWGTKLHDMTKVKELVNCDDEALKMYRH